MQRRDFWNIPNLSESMGMGILTGIRFRVRSGIGGVDSPGMGAGEMGGIAAGSES